MKSLIGSMMTDFILLLSYKEDSTALRILEQVKRRQYPVILMDTADFPLHIQLDARIGAGELWWGNFVYEGLRYHLTDIRSILSRRPRQYQGNTAMPEIIQAFEQSEAYRGMGGILRSLDCLWVNPLDAQRRAGFKPLQLQKASELGFRIPKTLITNEPAAVLDFFEECHGKMISKTIHGNFFAGGGDTYYILHTSVVLQEHLQRIERVRATAHLFQEYIEKKIELRCTIIGNTVLTVAITSQQGRCTQIDWRASYQDLRYSVYSLPAAIEKLCIQITQSFDLVYGAIDMIVTPNDEYVFLEINPGGQWEWLAAETGLPFAETIADVLIAGKGGKR